MILDCRTSYETDVGIFEGAKPLGTTNFRDSWGALKECLANTLKDAPIMTYCTGGVCCVKVEAYLTQEMGFTNVSRLAGVIMSTERDAKAFDVAVMHMKIVAKYGFGEAAVEAPCMI